MNIFEDLNNKIQKFLEGDVVSFADFKKAKEVDKLSDINSKEIEDSVVHINISAVKTQNYKIDGVEVLNSSEYYDFKYLQSVFYALDYVQEGESIPFNFKAFLEYERNGETVKDESFDTIIIGQGREQANMLNKLDYGFVDTLGRTPIFDGDIVPSESDVQKKIIELQNNLRKTDTGHDLPAKDYTKNPADVEVGDILVCEWGYSMRLVDYYRVISRTKSTIKLEHLKGRRITNDGWTGEEVPTDSVEKDDNVDGKSFRIGYKYNKDVVCRIKDHSCEFWDGKPKYFDTLD